MKSSVFLFQRIVSAAALLAAFLLIFAPRHAAGITRQWTGLAGAPFAWSASNNWSPTGTPQTNDDLVFAGMIISSNDISGAVVQTMRFNPLNPGTSILRGLAVTVRNGVNGNGGGGMGGANFDVQCPVILDNDQSFQFDGSRLTFSGGVDLNGHHLNLNSFPVGANMFVGPISGTGSINANAGGTVHLFGTNNTFTGTFRVSSGLVVLEKTAGQLAIPATGRLEIAGFARVQLQGNDQIFDTNEVVLESNAQLLLNGFNEVLSGGVTLGGGAVVDCGNNFATPGLTLFNTLTVRATNSPAVIRNGIVDLRSSLVTLDIDGPALPALEISANLIGTGFVKTGAGVLRLSGTNSYTNDAIIAQGIVEAFHRSAFGATSGVVQLNGGSIRLSNLSITNEALVASASAFQSSNDIRQPIFGAGLFLTGTCGWAGPVRLDTNLFTFADNNGVAMTFSGVVSGPAGLLISSGAYDLSGPNPNTYTGETLVSAAQLRLFKAGAVGGALVIGTTVTGDSAATHFAHNAVAGRAVRVNGNDAYYLLNNFNQELIGLALRDGGRVMTGVGTLSFSGTATLDVGSLTTQGSTSVASISGTMALVSGTTVACSVRGFSGGVAIIGPEFDIRATIAGAGTITKDGFGSMRFAGTNSFAGDVIVNEGALDLNNPGALGDTTFPIIVNNTGTLLLEVLGLSLPGIFFNGKTLILNSSNNFCALQSFNGSNTWNGPIVLSRDSVICAGDYLNVPTSISGPGGLILGGGVLQFSGFSVNTYGRTIVRDGRLDAFRPIQISIPGDVVVGEGAQPPTTATLRILRDRQISPNANLNVGGNGAFILLDSPGPAPRVQVRTISGGGVIHVDPGSVFTVSNDVPCRFDGRMEANGFITKFGSSVMEWTGLSSTYSGTLIVEAGEFLMNGAALSMHVQANTNAVVRGDGDVRELFIKPQGILGADSKFPDHQGGDLTTETLFLAAGSTLSLDFFGPAPSGSNDQIVATGTGNSVSLNGANLQPNFRYPPRSGDVIMVVNKDSAGPIVGTFNNWPQGTERTFNSIPLHINYTGGTGNDITLTVTNLGLSFFNYTLVEGNGNQTVEPNECNLLFISLFNRRPSTLRITNAVLRSLTADALVTIPSASYPPITIGNVAANITPFQFRTRSGIGCPTPVVTFELVLGVANEAEFAITFSPVSGNDCSNPTGPCESCTVVSGRLDSNAPTTLKPIYFAGGQSLCFPPKACPGVDTTSLFPVPPTMSYVTHSLTNSATNAVCVTVQIGYSCPSFIFPRVAAYLGSFDTNDVCANYLGDGGVSGGTSVGLLPFSFRVPAGSNFVLVVTTRSNLACPDYTLHVFGLPCPPPSIGIGSSSSAQVSLAAPAEPTRRGGPLIGINWSTATPGWTAQEAARVEGPFNDVLQSPTLMDGRYVLTNIPATNQHFFRLRRN